MLFLGLAILFLALAAWTVHAGYDPQVSGTGVFGVFSALVFSTFTAIFGLLALSLSPNETAGRSLTVFTAAVSCTLLLATAVLLAAGIASDLAHSPALAAAFMMVLRAVGLAVLPPRGDRSGLAEASGSVALALASGAVCLLLNPAYLPEVVAGSLLLSWPHLVDGINAFADKVFHKAAFAAGARELAPGAFTTISRARHIVIDKAAVMSGPDLMVTNVMAFNNEPKTLLAVAASAEAPSSHPVGLALRQLAAQWRVDVKTPDRFEPAQGLGVVALLGGQTVVIGTTDLLKRLKIDSFTADAIARSLEADGKTVLRVAVGGKVVGVLGLEGTLRQDAGVAGVALRSEGLTPWLHTQDSPKTRDTLAGMLGLDSPDETLIGETAPETAARLDEEGRSLVLTLSPDRSSLELYACMPGSTATSLEDMRPIAVAATDDIGAYPALKALAMRRNLLALWARRVLVGFWGLCGLCGATAVLPLTTAPLILGACLLILFAFAQFSVTGRQPGPDKSHMLRPD